MLKYRIMIKIYQILLIFYNLSFNQYLIFLPRYKMNLGSVAILNISLIKDEKSFSQLNDLNYLKNMCDSIIQKIKLTPLKDASHQFEPQGVSIIYLLAESHLSIHTWPENHCFAMDIHSCNYDLELYMESIKKLIYSYMNVKEYQFQVILRKLVEV
jgi:S-adenosylmethionine decarboxylase proenzyme